MQISFSYEVSKYNSLMYPGPDLTKLQALNLSADTESIPHEEDPGYRKDPLWICSLCHKQVLDEKGMPKTARTFEASLRHKEPANWYHCDPCRLLSREDKGKMSLQASAEGTPPIDHMFGAAMKW